MKTGIPWRAILIGLLLLPINAFWLVQMEMSSGGPALSTWALGPYPTTFSLFANVICFTVVLILFNLLARRWRPQWVLSQAEVLIIYSMLAIGT
ncbi:MAG: PIG-T family GPI transamidase component, partial [Armatimonadetes bacterium]|nr:PIG-T family GPI transamidase component [Armatimonadota bacterium]